MREALEVTATEPLVSIVVPVHDEEEGIPELRRRVEQGLAAIEGRYEVIVVDDGSTDGSARLIEAWCAEHAGIVLVQLSRNFGLELAMTAGLDFARGRYTVLMHADIQDPPELVPEMLALAREQGADVVYARRIGGRESRVKHALAGVFYGLMGRIARTPYQGQAGDFRLMSRRVVEAVRGMHERRRFLRGMVAWVGYKQVPIDYERAGRESGRGATYPALFRLALEAIVSFSDVPLRLATYVGTAIALASGLSALAILALTLAGVADATLDLWILAVVLFLGGVQLVSMGILGRYLARVHEQSLQRPLYLVDRVVGHDVAAPPVLQAETRYAPT
jgi:polyisoprenyl-phosphate glycosyltransferase